ncbi:class A beta-lactamase-related serine hydrolase [Maribacter algicola]|uniref:Class A beta-lactamase-related serine hydrolase n=1 Tax=Maribacter algicola TaxID=2498892 RepID=A0A3R8RZB8_9FLAO|nr:class A beta-lactamase-related serine hydrolase [Maribacter algicola]
MVLILFVFSAATIDTKVEEVSPEEFQQRMAMQKEAKIYASRKRALKLAINQYFNEALKFGEIAGAGVSIVKGDSIILAEGFGKRNNDKGTPVNAETVFRLGSLSKGFTGVLAAKLVEEGAFDFMDKVTDYLPEFVFGDSTNTRGIKIAHLLSHTSGAPYHSYTNLVEAGLAMDKIAVQFREVEPLSEPGVQYSYQNAMFALSQEVMLRATSQNINSLLIQHFFGPLGMSRTSMDHASFLKMGNIAEPHVRSGNSWRILPLKDNYYNAVAAGGIDASADDMGKWMRFLLGHNTSVMAKSNLEKAFEPFIELNENNKYYQRWEGHLKSAYAFGWRIHTMKNETTNKEETIVHHGGSVNSYRNEIALFPDADLGICVLMNNHSGLAKHVIPDLRAIVKHIYELSPDALASL